MPYIEEALEESRSIWGEYLPKRLGARNSGVMVKNLGCVFVGTVSQCQEYIEQNAHRYEKKDSQRLLTR